MAKLTFLWHLHQPQYRTSDGRVHAPWVLLHAAGEYLSLLRVIAATSWSGQVLNLTPVFLEQLQAYRDGTAHDPLLEALRTPARDLLPAQQVELLRWAFLHHPRQLERWPRLQELASRAAGATTPEEMRRRYTVQDLSDLQVLTVLAYAGPNLGWEPELSELAANGSGWGPAASSQAVDWLAGCPGRVLDAYREVSQIPGVEIATSPFAHPIMPLLVDTGIVADSWAPHPAPAVPPFAAPEDAHEHLRAGLELVRSMGFAPVGCWPPEGSVSADALAVYRDQGIRWLATDEGILAASLGHPVSGETGVRHELFVPWQLPSGGPSLFFRHRSLSDFIGFQASRYSREEDAASDLVQQLRHLAHQIPDDAGILVALDGENPWTSYPEGGVAFLTSLARQLEPCAELRPNTLSERARDEGPRTLQHLHPGSWIGGTFGTWIGHPEKNRAWEFLANVRKRGGWRGGASWLAAEGSDWWWWLGDDNPTLLAPLYDELFRLHLQDACRAAGIEPPAELSTPVRSAAVGLQVPLTTAWPEPRLDGHTTGYFEWAVAAWVEAPSSHHHLARVALRISGETLWLRVDTRPGAGPPTPLVVTLVVGDGRRSWTLPSDSEIRCAVGTCLEAALPLPVLPATLAIEHRGERLPAEGFWRLEALDVEES